MEPTSAALRHLAGGPKAANVNHLTALLGQIQLQSMNSPGSRLTLALRLDLIDPDFGGNKLPKILPYLALCMRGGYRGIITHSGGRSNYLIAVAAASAFVGIECTVIARADPGAAPFIEAARSRGAKVVVSEADSFGAEPTHLSEEAARQYPDHLFVPEGASGKLGIAALSETLSRSGLSPGDTVFTAMGTGGTAMSAALATQPDVDVRAVPTFRGLDDYEMRLARLSGEENALKGITVVRNYHFGGFGRTTANLRRAAYRLESDLDRSSVDLRFTAKMYCAYLDMVETLPEHRRVILLINSLASGSFAEGRGNGS